MSDDLKPAPDGYPIKLVRDQTPEVINGSGEPGELFYGPLSKEQNKMVWLRQKLGEEAVEYLIGGSYSELLDVLAVVKALCVSHGRTFAYSVLTMEGHGRGGFDKGVMMYGRHPEFDGRGESQ